MRSVRPVAMLWALALSVPVPSIAWAANLLDPIANNPSFESPDIPFALNVMDVWHREGPGIFNPDNPSQTLPELLGIGVFDNPPNDPQTPGADGHLNGADGAQVAYIFSHSLPEGFPQTFSGAYKDHAVSQVTSLTYDAGKQYNLTISFANATSVASPTASVLTFSLFATTDPNATSGTIVASDTITSAELNQTDLVPFPIVTPAIAGGITGQFIGIRISTHSEPSDVLNSPGQFDFDNVQLTIVPEPASAALLVAGSMGLLATRRRQTRS
jgi:hypothetical protein